MQLRAHNLPAGTHGGQLCGAGAANAWRSGRWARWVAAAARILVVVGLLGTTNAAQELLALVTDAECCPDEVCDLEGPAGCLGAHGCQSCSFCSHPSALPAPGSPVPAQFVEPGRVVTLRDAGHTLAEHRTPLLRPPAG